MTEQSAFAKTEKKAKSAVPSVEKAFDILELLAGAEDGLTMNEMVDALGRTMGEIYRIVVYLTERGFLAQNPETSRYALTLKLFELSHRHDPTERLIARAVPILERIAALTEQSCHLGVLNRDNVLVLASVQSPRPAGYSVRTGALFSVDRTSSGHVILAFAKAAQQNRYIERLDKSAHADVRERLKRIAARGYEDTPSTMIEGVRNLCVPVFDSRGIAAAITSGYISQSDLSTSAEETLATLRRSAVELSQSLGFRMAESGLEAILLH
ncbi:IclR family transcriptional regulator [Jannaschia marina]|uniref:IclR family transcriptional regulator n=1 Tax=Jannaschia marina TaxID=2741674 RepID=UPI0015C8AE7C|nr:IclR family transcriptional regulator [Jannaschia marina]